MSKRPVTSITNERWLVAFSDAVEHGNLPAALATLESQATAHAGTAPAAQKRAAARMIVAAAKDLEALAGTALWFAHQASPTGKEIGAMLLARSYPQHPTEATSELQRLADDGNWEVREWAGSAAGDIFAANFDELLPQMQEWTGDASQFVRRAVCLAVRGAAEVKHPERAVPLLDLIDVLAQDSAEEVKRNTGPFAVGGSLLGKYPEETLLRVRVWAGLDDEMLRWNAAMVFVAANAEQHIDDALDILSQLAPDKRRPVWMAVGSAAKNLVKRDRERVEPELRKWLADDRKLPASLALRHITINKTGAG